MLKEAGNPAGATCLTFGRNLRGERTDPDQKSKSEGGGPPIPAARARCGRLIRLPGDGRRVAARR